MYFRKCENLSKIRNRLNTPNRNTFAIFAMVGAFSVPSNQKANQKVAKQDSRVRKKIMSSVNSSKSNLL